MRYLSLLGVGLLLVAGRAAAQPHQAPQPPPAQYQPAPSQYQPPPPGYGQPQYQGQGGSPPPSQPYYQQQPMPAQYPAPPPERESHAPKYSLWTGARLSYVGWGFSFFENEAGTPETTGNFLGNGVAPQLDVGARISYRYIPYLFWEHGFMGAGHRFEGAGPGRDATSSTDFYGLGFRYVSGDVDSVGFLTDIAIGQRVLTVSNGTQTYKMSGIEFFRLGLGAEIRVATLFTLTPLASISGGSFNDTEGDISYKCAPNCDGPDNGPRYQRGAVIDQTRAYVVLSLGVGIHFDVFGK